MARLLNPQRIGQSEDGSLYRFLPGLETAFFPTGLACALLSLDFFAGAGFLFNGVDFTGVALETALAGGLAADLALTGGLAITFAGGLTGAFPGDLAETLIAFAAAGLDLTTGLAVLPPLAGAGAGKGFPLTEAPFGLAAELVCFPTGIGFDLGSGPDLGLAAGGGSGGFTALDAAGLEAGFSTAWGGGAGVGGGVSLNGLGWAGSRCAGFTGTGSSTGSKASSSSSADSRSSASS